MEMLVEKDVINFNCANNMVEALESKGINDAEIARRCNVNPSRIHAWRNGEKAGKNNLQKLRELMNMRLPSRNAHSFDVTQFVRLPVTEVSLEQFLQEQIKTALLAEGTSFSLDEKEKISSAESLGDINLLIAESYRTEICRLVDLELQNPNDSSNYLHQKSPYTKPYKILPSSYQVQMERLSDSLTDAIQRAEERLGKVHAQEDLTLNLIKRELHSTVQQVSLLFQRQVPEQEITQQISDGLERIAHTFKPQEIACSYLLEDLVRYMTRMACFLEDSQFGPKFGMLRLNDNPYFQDISIERGGVISVDDFGFMIDSASRLLAKFEDFREEQKERYEALYLCKSREVKLVDAIAVDSVFNLKKVSSLSSDTGLKIQDFLTSDISDLSGDILKVSSLNYKLFNVEASLDVTLSIKEWLKTIEVEGVNETIQVAGDMLFDKNEHIVFALSNNDLVLLHLVELNNQKVMAVRHPLTAKELLCIVDQNLKPQVKHALLENGYLLSDVTTLA